MERSVAKPSIRWYAQFYRILCICDSDDQRDRVVKHRSDLVPMKFVGGEEVFGCLLCIDMRDSLVTDLQQRLCTRSKRVKEGSQFDDAILLSILLKQSHPSPGCPGSGRARSYGRRVEVERQKVAQRNAGLALCCIHAIPWLGRTAPSSSGLNTTPSTVSCSASSRGAIEPPTPAATRHSSTWAVSLSRTTRGENPARRPWTRAGQSGG